MTKNTLHNNKEIIAEYIHEVIKIFGERKLINEAIADRKTIFPSSFKITIFDLIEENYFDINGNLLNQELWDLNSDEEVYFDPRAKASKKLNTSDVDIIIYDAVAFNASIPVYTNLLINPTNPSQRDIDSNMLVFQILPQIMRDALQTSKLSKRQSLTAEHIEILDKLTNDDKLLQNHFESEWNSSYSKINSHPNLSKHIKKQAHIIFNEIKKIARDENNYDDLIQMIYLLKELHSFIDTEKNTTDFQRKFIEEDYKFPHFKKYPELFNQIKLLDSMMLDSYHLNTIPNKLNTLVNSFSEIPKLNSLVGSLIKQTTSKDNRLSKHEKATILEATYAYLTNPEKEWVKYSKLTHKQSLLGPKSKALASVMVGLLGVGIIAASAATIIMTGGVGTPIGIAGLATGCLMIAVGAGMAGLSLAVLSNNLPRFFSRPTKSERDRQELGKLYDQIKPFKPKS